MDRSKLKNALVIKKHADISLRAKPTDATTLHLVGQWHLSLATLVSIAQRTNGTAHVLHWQHIHPLKQIGLG